MKTITCNWYDEKTQEWHDAEIPQLLDWARIDKEYYDAQYESKPLPAFRIWKFRGWHVEQRDTGTSVYGFTTLADAKLAAEMLARGLDPAEHVPSESSATVVGSRSWGGYAAIYSCDVVCSTCGRVDRGYDTAREAAKEGWEHWRNYVREALAKS